MTTAGAVLLTEVAVYGMVLVRGCGLTVKEACFVGVTTLPGWLPVFGAVALGVSAGVEAVRRRNSRRRNLD